MHVKLQVKHAKNLVECVQNAVDRHGGGSSYAVGASIQIAPGLLNDSGLRSFLKALKGALSKFDESAACVLELDLPVVSESQREIEEAVQQEFESRLAAERKLLQAASDVKRGAGIVAP